MFVYCIKLEDKVYYGSTKNQLSIRKASHNKKLRDGIKKCKLYETARELGITHLDLELIYQGEDFREMEHEFIINDPDCLNMCGAVYDRKRALRLHREAQQRYLLNKKNKNVSN
jgi:hypothetical protein